MNAHALAVLEFHRVLALVAERAGSALGAQAVRDLRPSADAAALGAEHARVAAVRALVSGDPPWGPEPVPEVGAAIARLRIEGTLLTATELQGVLTLLRSSRRTAEALRDPRRPAVVVAVLGALGARLVSAKAQEEAIERVVADDGTVRDEASPQLRRIRRELAAAEGELVRLLERLMTRLEPHHQVTDMSVTVRNGRYVIPVRREARVVVGGIVHDTSSTGATLFVEPPAAVEFGNRIRELEAEEQREIDRILLELADRLRPLQPEMRDALDALVDIDSLAARARFAVQFRCGDVELCDPATGFSIADGRHPLLTAQGIDVVPFDLSMGPDERTLLISGPNTGGKTVLLKSIGLCSALAQSGVPVPVASGSRVAVFDDIFADVGDEQSIEASLSTFSAHLKNQAEILEAATSRSLVLMDEVGSGTDPVEGAALGGAILETLTRRRVLSVATTHLGALKLLATEVPGVVNASLQFDEVALAPTYRLIKGIPGRSYGISIARRLRLPEDVIGRAEERVPKGERDVAALLASLEQREVELDERRREVERHEADNRERGQRVAEREQRVRAREREVEKKSREEARRYLLDARAEVERTIKALQKAGADAAEEAGRAARKQIEEAAAAQAGQLDRLEREERNRERERARREGREERRVESLAPQAGDLVEVGTLGNKIGRLLDVRDGSGIVAVGAIKMTVPMATLRRSAQQRAPAEVVVPMMGDVPDVYAPSEIDVRGMRVIEVEEAVMQALDSAVRADLRSVRIIHGKGTGALRDRVTEMLRKDTRVKSFRLGAWNEGGIGVTVAEIA